MNVLFADSAFLNIVDRIDPDIVGAIGIVTVVMTFVLAIVTVVTITRTIQNITLARMHRQMVNEMLAKGYSVGEIDQLVNGHRKSILTRFFDSRSQEYVSSPRPTAPVKPQS